MSRTLDLVLASQSVYRRQQLQQLAVDFIQQAADIDETPKINESIDDYVGRLAIEKAGKVAKHYDTSWVIGSDQACSINGVITSKPVNRQAAINQLQVCSGQHVRFTTGVALVNQQKQVRCHHIEHFDVYFRTLSDQTIERYIDLEQPFDCAGSFKVEGLGIHLFKSLDGRDYNSLIGLPLIALVDLFEQQGINLLSYSQTK